MDLDRNVTTTLFPCPFGALLGVQTATYVNEDGSTTIVYRAWNGCECTTYPNFKALCQTHGAPMDDVADAMATQVS